MFFDDQQRPYFQATRSPEKLESQLYHTDCEVELNSDADSSSESDFESDAVDEVESDTDDESVFDLPLDFRHAHRPPGLEKRRITTLIAASSTMFAFLYSSCWVLGKLVDLGVAFGPSFAISSTSGPVDMKV
ncbi:hypothetical protein MRS44_004268 [Fusarium solani]|jgi:hypothetical protein|uniref:uncharacterized protein n=1 Tax=Fusarium solani TaxID=169388 RepID=UPI0032C40BD6|nr:hypothetical protein MRS44_004268 [Fusarium solani]